MFAYCSYPTRPLRQSRPPPGPLPPSPQPPDPLAHTPAPPQLRAYPTWRPCPSTLARRSPRHSSEGSTPSRRLNRRGAASALLGARGWPLGGRPRDPPPPTPRRGSRARIPAMNDRSPWMLALSTANLLVVLAGAVLIRSRLGDLEATTDRRLAALEAQAKSTPTARPDSDRPGDRGGEEGGPVTLADLNRKVGKLGDDLYDYYTEIMGDLNEIKRSSKQAHAATRSVLQALAKEGQPLGTWGLAPPGDALAEPALADYRKHAEMFGVRVAPGVVEVRGFLNMSPWTTMPIEYFVTRWPESGHETLLHVLGPRARRRSLTPDRLKGLVTAIYKGLVARGLRAGRPHSRFDPPAPATRTSRAGWPPPATSSTSASATRCAARSHVARATDWVDRPVDERPVLARGRVPLHRLPAPGRPRERRRAAHRRGGRHRRLGLQATPTRSSRSPLASNLDNRLPVPPRAHPQARPRRPRARRRPPRLRARPRRQRAHASPRSSATGATPLATAPVLLARAAEGGPAPRGPLREDRRRLGRRRPPRP